MSTFVWKKLFYPLYHTASQRTKLPTSFKVVAIPSNTLISCLYKGPVLLWKICGPAPGEGSGASRASFPSSLLFASLFFATGVEYCHLCYPAPLKTVAVTSSWNMSIILFQAYLWAYRLLQSPALRSPTPAPAAALPSAGSPRVTLSVLEGVQGVVCIGSRTERCQGPIAGPPWSVDLAASGPQTQALALLVLHPTLCLSSWGEYLH